MFKPRGKIDILLFRVSAITLRTFIKDLCAPCVFTVSIELSCKELGRPESGLLVEFSAWACPCGHPECWRLGQCELLFSSGLKTLLRTGLPSLSVMGRERDT